MAESWTNDELKIAVAAYASMLARQEAQEPFTKADVYRALLTGPLSMRSQKSIEYRMMNISAVMEELGLPRVTGLAPAVNVGTHVKRRLAPMIVRVLSTPEEGTFFDTQPEIKTAVLIQERVTVARSRLGQAAFSAEVRRNYGSQCCFPSCNVTECDMLIGAHIARWADVPHLRGEISNGICLCALHDRAFEVGFFTITADCAICADTAKTRNSEWAKATFMSSHGQLIRKGVVLPSVQSLEHHWHRIGVMRPL